MLHQMIAMIALAVTSPEAGSQGLTQADLPAPISTQRANTRFWVQFRQPDWRDQSFYTPEEMDNFVAEKRRNGWELRVSPRDLRVSFRLMQWGGSSIFYDLREAQDWARYLETQANYQTRIVDHP